MVNSRYPVTSQETANLSGAAPPPLLAPAAPLADVPGLGPVRCRQLERLGLFTVGDLLTHYPHRYEDRRQFPAFPNAATDTPVCVRGVVVHAALKRFGAGRKTMFEATLQEPAGHALSARLVLRWFNAPYIAKMIIHGQQLVAYGKVKQSARNLAMDHPEIEILEDHGDNDEETGIHLRRIVPVYATTEGLPQRTLRALVFRTLRQVDLMALPTPLPRDLDPFPRGLALQWIHFPADETERLAGRRHLVLTEFFAMQLLIAARRTRAVSRPGENHCGPGRLLRNFLEDLPFAPTGAQVRAMDDIRADLFANRPMNRLLQGDVGAGKTLVALAAMLLCVEAGYQAALMAPTQILAEQHYLNFRRLLSGTGIRLALRTGSRREDHAAPGPAASVGELAFFNAFLRDGELPAATPRPSADAVVIPDPPPGEPHLIIGTHALLHEKNPPPRLGLAIVDEQHKFGVLQRQSIAARHQVAPDVLVMTATPIPRTLAITVYGDLDVSVLDELPAGRGRIVTAVRPETKLPEATAFIRVQLEAGRQSYVVYPLIEESEKLSARAATERFEYWTEALKPYRVGLLHGRIGPEEKDAIMADFRDNRIHVLVSTTVIEVGIDVRNANLMLIENAERFGLAQLHQLRGRIGRGEHKSYCLLFTGNDASLPAREKLRVLEETSDGFKIAEADLRLRGPGDILGTAQSGLPPLKLGNLVDDADLMREARAAARALFDADPRLERPEHARFRHYVTESRKLALAQVS